MQDDEPEHAGADAGQLGATHAVGRELYWDGVAQRAVQRAGRGPQLKGVIHEIAYQDAINVNPSRVLAGESAKLTKSATARAVDVVTTRGAKVVGRAQLKDVVSEAGQAQLRKKVAAGQYRTAKLVGTKETTAAYNAGNPTKQMVSSGISSETTTRAADNAGAAVRNSELLLSNAKDIARFGAGAAAAGAFIGAAAEAVGSYRAYDEGELEGGEYAGRVAKAGAVGGAAAGGRTVAALALKECAKQVAQRAGSEAVKRAVGSNPVTAVAFGVVEQGIDTVRLAKGDLDVRQYGEKSIVNGAGVAGAIAGAEAGAIIGTLLFPGPGTAVGGVVGGVGGAIAAALGGGAVGKKLLRK